MHRARETHPMFIRVVLTSQHDQAGASTSGGFMERRSTQSRSRGITMGGAAACVAALLVVGAWSAPASATSFAAIRSTSFVDVATTVQVEGTIVVYSGREAFGSSDLIEPLPGTVQLRTDTGQSVTITGSLTEGIVSGSDFSGTLSVPSRARFSPPAQTSLPRSRSSRLRSRPRNSAHSCRRKCIPSTSRCWRYRVLQTLRKTSR